MVRGGFSSSLMGGHDTSRKTSRLAHNKSDFEPLEVRLGMNFLGLFTRPKFHLAARFIHA